MELKLENLSYQDDAIQSVVKVFAGTEKNRFENACFEGIRSNVCKLNPQELAENIKGVFIENGLSKLVAKPSSENDLCIEMETGTGKTLVYLKTMFELHKHFGFTKFIVLVPSVAIRQGILSSYRSFKGQLENGYGFGLNVFEYESKRLSKVKNFIEEQTPQVMVMTLASFNSEDKILNQAQREDLFSNTPFIDAIGKTNPLIFMDEPQEGMDTENSIRQIGKLNPLSKIRFSATHKIVRNLLFRLTPFDSYKQGLVKKIEVLTVNEKNDEASLKIELSEATNGTSDPKVKLRLWHQHKTNGKFEFKESAWLKKGEPLNEKTSNASYSAFRIARIFKSLKSGKWAVEFSNGTTVEEKQAAGNLQKVWELQIHWLIKRHFEKTIKLREKGIKCLSLIFIDRVANYMSDEPIIKRLFEAQYKRLFPEFFNGQQATDEQVKAAQGYYFAQKTSGEFADSEGGVKEQSKIYQLILEGKEELLTLENPVQFIFSHSALGVGWDNPNVFNIATLNTAYSEVRKRQEIGRGLRICVDQSGQRIYDAFDTPDEERINQLTVVPNESYLSFVSQYQNEIKEIYGTDKAGAVLMHTHKGEAQNKVLFKRSESEEVRENLRNFWKAMARETNYVVAFDEKKLVHEAIDQISQIQIADTVIEVASRIIHEFGEDDRKETFLGSDEERVKTVFAPLDLVEELSEATCLSYTTAFQIVKGLSNYDQFAKNPPKFIQQAAALARRIELDEMLRGLEYRTTGVSIPFEYEDYPRSVDAQNLVATPNKGAYDQIYCDSGSNPERQFAIGADLDPDVVCFIKLPKSYKIPTPIGFYEPDFGVVLRRKSLRDNAAFSYHFVVETKATNDLNDQKALTESEIFKIRCAFKHFNSLGIDAHFEAPIKDYPVFRERANKKIQNATAA